MDKKPNFALLIGAPKDGPMNKKDHADDLGVDMDQEGMDAKDAEMSAVKDMMSALKTDDHEMFSAALKDYMLTCFPDLQSGEEEDAEKQAPEGDDGGY